MVGAPMLERGRLRSSRHDRSRPPTVRTPSRPSRTSAARRRAPRARSSSSSRSRRTARSASRTPRSSTRSRTYSDVANVQARGKRNPNNQARGFINGLGSVPNPGFGKGATAFMPEMKSFSFSTITGYTDAAAATIGKRNSIWLSLVPASWQAGIQTTPGTPTDDARHRRDGQPSHRPRAAHDGSRRRTRAATASPRTTRTCSRARTPTTPDGRTAAARSSAATTAAARSRPPRRRTGSGAGFILLAVAGVIVALRRKQEEV